MANTTDLITNQYYDLQFTTDLHLIPVQRDVWRLTWGCYHSQEIHPKESDWTHRQSTCPSSDLHNYQAKHSLLSLLYTGPIWGWRLPIEMSEPNNPLTNAITNTITNFLHVNKWHSVCNRIWQMIHPNTRICYPVENVHPARPFSPSIFLNSINW